MPNRKYTLEDGKEWKERYEKGETFEQIGLSYDPYITAASIRTWALRAGLTPRSPGQKMNPKVFRSNEKAASTPPAIQTNVKFSRRRRQGKRSRSY